MKTISMIIFAFIVSFANVSAASLPGPVVSTEWLAKHQKDVLILDIRHDVKSFISKPVFKRDKKTFLTIIKNFFIS